MRAARHGVLASLFAAATPDSAPARPVTYPDGIMSMTEIDGETVLTQVDYTLNPKLAIGGYGLSEQGGERLSTGVVVNYLVTRDNKADSQANAYLMAGAGPSWVEREDGRGRDAKGSAWIAGEADWETRRVFVGGMGKLSLVGDRVEPGYRLRAGVAPYVAEAGALHSWVFLQVGRAAEPGETTQVTPVVRVFKGGVLAEAGVSLEGRGFGTLWFYF